ncbi:MAG: hypothetical protein K9M99_06230 [Candidatus Cloacimonetes bacterium]|nr:hypothetical protein [Candidatus Cloacimonadota bacterium]
MRMLFILLAVLLLLSCEIPKDAEGIIGLVDTEAPYVEIMSPEPGNSFKGFVDVEVFIRDISSIKTITKRLSGYGSPLGCYSFDLINQDGHLYTYRGDISHHGGQLNLSIEVEDDFGNFAIDTTSINVIRVTKHLLSRQAYEIEEDNNGLVWIYTLSGSSTKILYTYNNETGNLTEMIREAIGGFAFDPLTNHLWHCKTYYSDYFLVCRDEETNIIEECEVNYLVKDIMFTPEGLLCGLVERMHGDIYCTFSDGELQYPLGNSNYFRAFTIDQDGIKWFIEEYSLVRWDDEEVLYIDMPVRFYVQQMKVDYQNNLWIKGGDHLIKYDRENFECFEMPDQYSNWSSDEIFTNDPDGAVWISGRKTVKVINGEIVREYPFINYHDPKATFADGYGNIFVTGDDGDLYIINEAGLDFRQLETHRTTRQK